MAAQLIQGSGAVSLGYLSIAGNPTNTSAVKPLVITASSTARNLYVTTQDPTPGTITVTVRKNGSATTLTVTISGGNVSGADITHAPTFVSGDVMDVVVTTAGGATCTSALFTFELD